AIAYTVWESSSYLATGDVAGPLGSSHRLSAPYQALRTKDGYINIGAPNQSNYERFVNALDRADLIERDEFSDNASRLTNREALEVELERTLTEKTSEEWLVVMEEAGVPAGPIFNMGDVWSDEQVKARDLDVPLEHPTAGTVRNIGLAAKLYGTPGRITEPAPVFAQHTREVLVDAGYTSDEIDALVESGAVVTNDI
ncbi:MAG: CoA transferase, partial [Dehalococcoidia bacterium]|nr:CoA transferase [Dehalococcoidia bacterium]